MREGEGEAGRALGEGKDGGAGEEEGEEEGEEGERRGRRLSSSVRRWRGRKER